ncbi:hypothetical protein ES705_33582 [subsurface metagenome]
MTFWEMVGVVAGSGFLIILGVIGFFAFREGITRYFMQ